MHVPEAQLPYQISYFNVVIYGVLFSILRNCLSCYFSGLGRTKVVMVAALVSVVVNVALDYILIFGDLVPFSTFCCVRIKLRLPPIIRWKSTSFDAS
jgi:Na+-driven multidrug efflux pump